MSWKSIVTAGLFCVLTVPAWAVPSSTVTLVRGPNDPGPADPVLLDSNGDFQWQVTVTPDSAQVTAGNGTVGLEGAYIIGGTGLVGAANNNAGEWDRSNPGTVPAGFGSGFGWLTLTDTDPTAGVNNRPVGLQSNTANDEVFAALGSIDYTTSLQENVVLISALGPSKGATATFRTSSVQWGGAFTGSGVLAQTPLANTAISGTTGSYVAVVADANLNGVVDLEDFNRVINNFGSTTANWNLGNFNNTKNPANVGFSATTVDLSDFNDVINFFGNTVPGGGGISTVVPEPASLALLLLALSMMAGVSRRR